MNNPYRTDPVTTPQDFYGREEEVEEIFLLIKKLQPISLIGATKIGCTSLLYYILHPDIVKKYVNQSYLLMYMNFEEMKTLSQTEFWRLTLEKMGKVKGFEKTVNKWLDLNDCSFQESYKTGNKRQRVFSCRGGESFVGQNYFTRKHKWYDSYIDDIESFLGSVSN